MSRENIRIKDPNFTSDGEYFYSLIKDNQILQVKTDDGNTAFSFPIDTTIGEDIVSLEWDGVYFWSLEPFTAGEDSGFIIRKWAIASFILQQISMYTFTSGSIHTYDAQDFAVEHYRLSVGDNNNGSGGYTSGIKYINISDTSKINSGDILTFVRANTTASMRYATTYVETAVVEQVISSTQVKLTMNMSGDPYSDGKGFRGPSASYTSATTFPPPDHVYLTKSIWVLNDNAPSDTTTAAIYKINAYNGSNIIQYSGTQYSDVDASTFYTKYTVQTNSKNTYHTTIVDDSAMGGLQTYLIFVKGSTLMFYNVSTNTIDRSMAISTIKENGIDYWDVVDLTITGFEPNITLCRLQDGTSYGDPISDESWTYAYNYERSILRRYVNSISIYATPSIISADGASTSVITAIVRDQYNTVATGKTVDWADDAGGRLSPIQSDTDAFGRATTTYTAGTTELDVKITATVQDGLI